MLRKLIVLTLALLLAMPALAMANFRMGDTTFTLSGTGSSDTDFDRNNFAGSFSLGHFFTDGWEGLIRQDAGISYLDGSTRINAATSLGLDYNWNFGGWVPFAGVNIGYLYGSGVDDTFFAGPEVGMKFFINNTTFVQALVQYQWFFDRMRDIDDFDEDRFVYGLGMGVRW
jgi:hypothetical protein